MTIREDPPPHATPIEARPKGRPAVWDEHLAAARALPGIWHKVAGDFDRGHMRRLEMALSERARGSTRSRHNPKLPPGLWEFRYARTPSNHQRVELWARLVPGST